MFNYDLNYFYNYLLYIKKCYLEHRHSENIFVMEKHILIGLYVLIRITNGPLEPGLKFYLFYMLDVIRFEGRGFSTINHRYNNMSCLSWSS